MVTVLATSVLAATGVAFAATPKASTFTGSSSGTAKSGVKCTGSNLQVTWTPYAPPCVAKFTGNNGGATGQGVTGSTITIGYRHTPVLDGLYKQTGSPTTPEQIADMQTLFDLFNKNFETYGRKVVLKDITGKGSGLDEANGQGQAGAQADAQAEKDAGVFADIAVQQTPYVSALKERGIIALSTPYTSLSTYKAYSPYMYGLASFPIGDDWGASAGATVCQRMNGMPAIFAGDASTQAKKRVFGLVQTPSYAGAGKSFVSTSKKMCNLKLANTATYNFDFATEGTQAVSIIAAMKAAGVTTIVHAGDPLMLAQLSTAAAKQDYHPEIVALDGGASGPRLGDASVMNSLIAIGVFGDANLGTAPTTEAGKVFRLASGGKAPQGVEDGGFSFSATYMTALQLFAAIQAAGPKLNAKTYQSGRASLPSATGIFGLWKPSKIYDVNGDYTVSRYNSTATNTVDGKKGTPEPCDGGKRYPYSNMKMGSGQLKCG